MTEENTAVETVSETRDFSPAQKKKILKKSFLAYELFSMRMFTFERMMGPDMVSYLLSVREELYPGDEAKQREMAVNHCVFFNTQPTLGTIVWGVVLGLEMERAKNPDAISNDMIQSIKAAIAAPVAGIGDTLAQSLLIPILLSIALGMSSTGSPAGFWFFIVVYSLIMYPASYFLMKLGLNMGIDGAEKLLTSDIKDRVISAIETLGIIVIGGVLASFAHAEVSLEFVNGDMTVNVQEILDTIMPGLITLIGSFIVLWGFQKKHVKPLMMMLYILIAAIIFYATGIMGR